METLIVTNKAYQLEPKKYRASRALVEIARATSGGIVGLDFKANGVSVPEAITEQLRYKMGRVLRAGQIVTCMGDGGTALTLNALSELQKENRELVDRVVGIGAGGTMNNLYKVLRAAGNDHARRAKPLHLREVNIKIGDEEERLPFAIFSGTGPDAEFLNAYEREPRDRWFGVNAGVAGAKMAAKFFATRDQSQSTHIALTIPLFGIMNFPPEFDRLAEDQMTIMALRARNGLEAATLFAGYQVSGQSPDLLKWIWRNGGIRREIARAVPPLDWFIERAQDMKPEFTAQRDIEIQVTNPDGFFFHTDGTPHHRKVPVGNAVHCQFRTKPRSGPVSVYAYAV